jgi:hypothetical protein
MNIDWEFAKHTEFNDILGFKENDIEKFGVNHANLIGPNKKMLAQPYG